MTDLAMPEMNVLHLILRLSEVSGGTPVIAMSGQNAQQLLLAEDCGAVATLFKPVNPDLMMNPIDAAAERVTSIWANVWYRATGSPGPLRRHKSLQKTGGTRRGPLPCIRRSMGVRGKPLGTMHIGVLSDIHDNLPNLERALALFRERGIDTLFFLGDFCSPIPSRVLGAYEGTVHCVWGNGDGDRFAIRGFATSGFQALVLHGEWAEVEVGGRKVALTHYPFYGQALARTGDYDAVFSGHTHERSERRHGGTLFVNPGEVMGWQGRPSVVVWDTEANTVDFLELEEPGSVAAGSP